jgi:hypothetical protein
VSDRDFDPFIEEVARELKRPVYLDSHFDQHVMSALQSNVIPIATRRERRPWYRRPHVFSVTPLHALAAAALAGIVVLGSLRLRSDTDTQLATSPDTSVMLQPVANVTRAASDIEYEQFMIIAPEANSVALVGDFNDWDAATTPMKRVSPDGAWLVTLPLHPGRYEYQFEVNGQQRVNDPTRPQTSSAFGSPNSVVTIAAKD